uniref:Calmodulin like 4 n=1 Tax=Sander lucioperca TaxID=283035 RepID=A0A8D0A919_SANLU
MTHPDLSGGLGQVCLLSPESELNRGKQRSVFMLHISGTNSQKTAGLLRGNERGKHVDVPADWSGELDFSTFLSIMHRQLQQEAPQDEILEAMRMADKEQKGFILASELRAKLTGLGEKLTHREGKKPSADSYTPKHMVGLFTHILTLKNTKLIYK